MTALPAYGGDGSGRTVRCGFYVGTDGPDVDTPQCPRRATDARLLDHELVPTCAEHYTSGGFVCVNRRTYVEEAT